MTTRQGPGAGSPGPYGKATLLSDSKTLPRPSQRARHKSNSLYTHRPAFEEATYRLRKSGDRTWLAAIGAFEVLRVLYATDPSGEITLSDTRIAEKLGISRNTLSKRTALLESVGLIERIGRFSNGEEQQAGWRIVAFDRLSGREDPDHEPAQSLSNHAGPGHEPAHEPAQTMSNLTPPELAERGEDLQDLQDQNTYVGEEEKAQSSSATAPSISEAVTSSGWDYRFPETRRLVESLREGRATAHEAREVATRLLKPYLAGRVRPNSKIVVEELAVVRSRNAAEKRRAAERAKHVVEGMARASQSRGEACRLCGVVMPDGICGYCEKDIAPEVMARLGAGVEHAFDVALPFSKLVGSEGI